MSGWANNAQNLADCFRLYQLTRRCKSKRDFGDGGRKEKGLPWALQRIMGAVVYQKTKQNTATCFLTQPDCLCQNCFSYIFGLWLLLLSVSVLIPSGGALRLLAVHTPLFITRSQNLLRTSWAETFSFGGSVYALGWVFLYFSKLSIKHGSSYFEKTRKKFFYPVWLLQPELAAVKKLGT